jgi:hypothetical protein
MYCGVPRMVWSRVTGAAIVMVAAASDVSGDATGDSTSLAKPKSRSLTPALVSITFAGLRSR